MEQFNITKAMRSSLKKKVTQFHNKLKSSIQLCNNSSTIDTTMNELEQSYNEFLSVHDEFCSSIDSDIDQYSQFEVVNGLNREAYLSEVTCTFNEAVRLYLNHIKAEKVINDSKFVRILQETMNSLVSQLNCVTFKYEDPTTFHDQASLSVDKDEVESLMNRLQQCQMKLFTVEHVEVSTEKSDFEHYLKLYSDKKRSLCIQLKQSEKSGSHSRHSSHHSSQYRDDEDRSVKKAILPQAPFKYDIVSETQPMVNSLNNMKLQSIQDSHYQTSSTNYGLLSSNIEKQFMNSPIMSHHIAPVNAHAQTVFSSTYAVGASAFNTSVFNPLTSAASMYTTPLSQSICTNVLNVPTGMNCSQSIDPNVFNSIYNPTYSNGPTAQYHMNYIPPNSQINTFNNPGDDNIKCERMSMPTFSGFRKDWPQFKVEWKQIVEKVYKNPFILAKELKKALNGTEAAECIDSIANTHVEAYGEMWNRLCKCYDDVSANVQSALLELSNLKAVVEDDYKSFMTLVSKIESCHNQLRDIGHAHILTMIQVDDMCDLLPPSVRKDWSKICEILNVKDQLNPFPKFIEFLISEKNRVYRYADRQGKMSLKSKTASTHGTDTRESHPKKNTEDKAKCIIHSESSHSTEECSAFNKLSKEERLDSLRKAKVCFRCFGAHRRQYCKEKKACADCGLTNHHILLCRGINKQSTNANCNQSGETKEIVSGETNEIVSSKSYSARTNSIALYPIQQAKVFGTNKKATVFLDDGSDSCYITYKAAHRLKAKPLQKYILDVTTTGGHETSYESQEFEVKLQTESGKIVVVHAYGLERITGELSKLDLQTLAQLFPEYDVKCLQRPSSEVDLLIGSNLFGLHPKHEVCAAGDNLSIMKGELGLCLMGSHPALKEGIQLSSNMVVILHETTMKSDSFHANLKIHHEFEYPEKLHIISNFSRSDNKVIDDFILGNELTTEVNPRCGSCRCGKCPIIGHTYTFKEEQELELIRNNLTYNSEQLCWYASYPWVVDPYTLPNNYSTAFKTLISIEKRLARDLNWCDTYRDQLQDMIERGAAKKLSTEELRSWKGPIFYISHQAVVNPKSSTTPVRIVFNSSQISNGISLNECLAKGPDNYLNNLVGLLLRWREGLVAFSGDIKKMYNSVRLNDIEIHTHRFLWRDMEFSKKPDIYVVTRVNMGDKPAGTISTEAMYMTADRFGCKHPEAAKFVRESTYVDDLLDSVSSKTEALNLAYEVESLLGQGGFKVKNWLFSGENIPRNENELKTKEDFVDASTSDSFEVHHDQENNHRVLGIVWKPRDDVIVYKVNLNFSKKRKGVRTEPNLVLSDIPSKIPAILTRRIVLEQVMGIYDPLGFLSPFTLLAKQYLRETWMLKLEWDDPLPSVLYEKWVKFFSTMFEVLDFQFPRALKPTDAIDDPVLILLSDANFEAYGVVAYIRWKLTSGNYWSRLIMAKNRIAPLRKLSIPQLELNGAVLNKRCRKVLQNEMRFCFNQVIHIVDSKTVLHMINKLSHRFHVFEGVRIGEIQSATNGDMSEWYWIDGIKNIADWTTRVKCLNSIGPYSEWFNGPAFLNLPIEEWGLKSCTGTIDSLPGEKIITATHATGKPEKESFICYDNFSSFKRLLWAVSRVLGALRSRSFSGGKISMIDTEILQQAKHLIIKDVQHDMIPDLKTGLKKGKYSRLNPIYNETTGIWEVGLRLNRHNPMFIIPDSEPHKLLNSSHKVTRLLMQDAHINGGHCGRDATLARFRQEFWTPHGSKLARSVKKLCALCKLRDAKCEEQLMGELPIERLTPAPAFHSVSLDLFGPIIVRGEVQKRVSMKAYGVIFTDMVMRAVHLEAVPGYDSDSFLLALSRFTSIRGWPSQIFSDPGTQLVGAENELRNAWKIMNKDNILKVSYEHGLKWIFGPADSPWYQGTAESLIKSVKRSIKFSINNQRLSVSEFNTLLYEIANLLNERPIAVLPSDVESEINILTPNCLILGRSLSKNPIAMKFVHSKMTVRLQLVQQLVDKFWHNWVQTCAPKLIVQSKWHTKNRNFIIGDIVLIYDDNSLRGQYKLAIVKETFPSVDGIVRKVKLSYKNYKVGEKTTCYSGAPDTYVTRSVQRLSLLIPADESNTM